MRSLHTLKGTVAPTADVAPITRHKVPAPVLRAKDVMSAPVQVVDLNASVWEAWSLMLGSGLRQLVVVDRARCVGLVDDRTLFAQWPTGPLGVRSTPLRRLIRDHTTCVLPDTNLPQVARIMRTEGVDAVPVTDIDGTVVGVVTGNDIVASVATSHSLGASSGAIRNPSDNLEGHGHSHGR
jgi:CBS domain-containing protein